MREMTYASLIIWSCSTPQTHSCSRRSRPTLGPSPRAFTSDDGCQVHKGAVRRYAEWRWAGEAGAPLARGS